MSDRIPRRRKFRRYQTGAWSDRQILLQRLEGFEATIAEIVLGGEHPVQDGEPIVLAVSLFEILSAEHEFARNTLRVLTKAVGDQSASFTAQDGCDPRV